MTHTALLLVDLQEDYFGRPEMVPGRAAVISGVSALLDGFRAAGAPVVHIRTVVEPDGSNAMPHWRGQLRCVRGTPGAQPPVELVEAAGELVVEKQFFRGFANPRLEAWLRQRSVQTVVIAGLYTHACVRETALDAHERGFEVVLAAEALASDSPIHAAESLAWLSTRAASARGTSQTLTELATAHSADSLDTTLEVALAAATQAQSSWAAAPIAERVKLLASWRDRIQYQADELVESIVREVRKPVRFARDEVARAIAHIDSAIALAPLLTPTRIAEGVVVVPQPLGVIAALMPWNNPVALPVGKIAPALLAGNAVVLKPAPEATATAALLLDTLHSVVMQAGLVALVPGAGDVGTRLVHSPFVNGVTVTGSIRTGRAVAAACVQQGKPVQAELGGNNAAIVAADADLEQVVPALLRNGFGYAGQRCTAIRRWVIAEQVLDRVIALAQQQIADLAQGDPADAEVLVGPLISASAADRIAALIAEAQAAGAELLAGGRRFSIGSDAYVEPTLLLCRNPEANIVQGESFGPIVVVQPATDIDEAVRRANGVEQGLVMAACTDDAATLARIAANAKVGILQHGPDPVPVHPDAPFGGWKASGLGAPEHGVWDLQFVTRPQAQYGAW